MNKRFVNSPHPHVDNFARKRSPRKGENFLRRMAWDASGGAVRMRRRRGAICEAASAAPRAISFLSWQKRYGRKDRWNDFIALSRLSLQPLAFFAWLVSLPQPIETAEQKRAKHESLCTDSGQILFNFAGTNICRSKILDGRNSADRPKGVRTTDGVTTKRRTERQVFSARKRYSRPRRLFFAYFFLTSQKKVCPRSDPAPLRCSIRAYY